MPNTKQEIADLDGMEDIDCSLTKIRFSEDVRLVGVDFCRLVCYLEVVELRKLEKCSSALNQF